MSWFGWTLVTVGALSVTGCREEKAPAPNASVPTTPSASASTSALTRVDDRSTVCMVNDQYMASPQIAVPVAGKTYFGCCAMCKQKLESNESARTAKDPVSGRVVDKATAVIARNASGRVFYFEDEANMAKYGNL